MLVAVRVVDDGLLLDRFFGNSEIEMNAFPGLGSSENGKFEGGEGLAGVPIGFFREMLQRVIICLDRALPEPAGGVMDGPSEELDKVDGVERFELEYLRAGNEGGVDVEIGIMGGSPDEAYGAALKVWKQDVLLGLVEAVDLVDEEHRALVSQLGEGSGLFDLGPDIRYIGFDAVESLEAGASGVGNN